VDGIPVYRYPIAAAVTRAQARGLDIVPGAEHLHRWFARIRPDVVHFHTFVTGLALHEVEAACRASARVVVTSHAGSLGFLCERGTLMRNGHSLCDGNASDTACAECALQLRAVPGAGLVAQSPDWLSAAALRAPGPLGTVIGMRALIAANRRAQQALLSRIDAFVVLSEFAAQALRRSGAPPDKVILNRLGVREGDGPPAPRPPRTGRVVCGFAGRADAIKGIDDAVRAIVSLPRDLPIDLRVVTLSNSECDATVLRHCRELAGGDPRVRFDAAVDPSAVPRLLATFDVLLCPSRVVEGGPTIALEAHAVGTPVIGSRLPALSEIVSHEHNGLLHAPFDWQELASCLERIACEPALIERWRQCLPQVRTQDQIAADYLALYSRILSESLVPHCR
jgi:glycosyltransferase involved in cell wall biosynthesis